MLVADHTVRSQAPHQHRDTALREPDQARQLVDRDAGTLSSSCTIIRAAG